MCSQCDPKAMLLASGLKATPQRIRVLATVQDSQEALAPQVLLARLREDEPMDKVTLYRALDSLAEHGLITRHEAGDGSARYCAGGPAHPDHHHFYCLNCHRLLCLGPDAVRVGVDLPGVKHVNVRLDGMCEHCGG